MSLLERMNPEQIKQEQERVLKRVSETESQNWNLMVEVRMGKSRLLIVDGDGEGIAEVRGKKNAALMAAAPDIARAYAALLDAHLALHTQLAQAEGREKALREERDAYRKGLTTLINAPYMRDAWKHAESIVAQYGCEDCVGLTFEDGSIACWTCGRVLPDAQAGEG